MSPWPHPPGATARLAAGPAAAVLGAVILAACGSGSGTRIVDGWLIGPPRSCLDLGFREDRCERIVEAARAHAEATGGARATWEIHDATPVDAAGSPRLLASGSGMPAGILLVRRADGSEAATPIGCFQPISPRQPPDCP